MDNDDYDEDDGSTMMIIANLVAGTAAGLNWGEVKPVSPTVCSHTIISTSISSSSSSSK